MILLLTNDLSHHDELRNIYLTSNRIKKQTASLDWHLHYNLINRLPDPYTVHMDKNLYVIGVVILQVKQFG